MINLSALCPILGINKMLNSSYKGEFFNITNHDIEEYFLKNIYERYTMKT